MYLVWLMLVAALAVAVLGALWALRSWRSAQTQHPDSEPAMAPPSQGQSWPSPVPPTPDNPIAEPAQLLPDVLVDPAVRIEKAARLLTVFSDGDAVKRYRIALGRQPFGDKEREGDLRTPEGEFYICTRNSTSSHHRALGLSYPNAEDAERGLAGGLITKRDHRAILDAVRHMTRPPWKTALGGEIMIHGGGIDSDWTEGCIALSDEDADELFRALPLGTPVEIVA